jgi:hypothetical protein
MDQRPIVEEGTYDKYQDGRRGKYTKCGARSDYYCPACKENDYDNYDYDYVLK